MESNIWRITLDTNPEDCNLNCIMCEEHSPYSNFKEKLFKSTGVRKRRMPLEWLDSIISEAEALGVKEIIPSTMGDPLVSDHFIRIAELAKKHGMCLNVTHNGTFPGKAVDEWANLIIPITSDIKFSWNGASSETAEKIMPGINFNKTVENLKLFIEYRDKWFKEYGHYCQITFQLTFLRNNMLEVSEIIKLASELGVDRIKGHHVWRHFPELNELSFMKDANTRIEWTRIVEIAKKASVKFKRKNGRQLILENFDPIPGNGDVNIPENYDCPFLGRELWISATGKISPCCAPDEQRDSLGNFGNIKEIKLTDVIQSDLYRDLLKNYKSLNLCQTCNMRKPQK